MKIILSGGGTLGPVVPLLAIADAYRSHDPSTEFLWVGTKNGPEKVLVDKHSIPFTTIGTAKWRRYISFWNIVDIFKLVISFFQSIVLLWREKPDLLISAGGYVSVPLHYAAALLAMPTWVHQQDVGVGFANKLMFPLAHKITTALNEPSQKFPRPAEWIGNPSRDLFYDNISEAKSKFGIPSSSPVIFAMGGGTGSMSINSLILEALPQLNTNWHIIHLVGRDRPKEQSERAAGIFNNYHAFEFFTDEMRFAYAAAEVVVARAGFSTLTELASLSKAAIILPMSGTHQEENARYFASRGGIIALDKTANGLKLAQIIKQIITDKNSAVDLGKKLNEILPKTSKEKIVQIVERVAKLDEKLRPINP